MLIAWIVALYSMNLSEFEFCPVFMHSISVPVITWLECPCLEAVLDGCGQTRRGSSQTFRA